MPILFQIVEETPDLLVVDKAAGVLMHPSKPGGPRTLWHELREMLAYELVNAGQISLVNRLDRETSGLVLVAKTREAASRLGLAMMRREIVKEYRAIVWGWPEWEQLEIEAPILRQGEAMLSPIYLKQMVHDNGAKAITRVQVERRFERETSAENRFALLRVDLLTGRMHQIRVHLAHVGHPVVGDKIYGPSEQCYLEFIRTGWTDGLASRLLLPRHALHCGRMALRGGSEWQSTLPEDLAVFASEKGSLLG